MASSFEGEVCGEYFNLRRGCEFGIQGRVETGPFDPRTGLQAVRIDRTSPQHMGVVTDTSLPEGNGFVGAAHRIPAIPDGAIRTDIQLMQLSPSASGTPGRPVEVRFLPDRRLGLALHQGDDVVVTEWPAPVDQWFYIVVEVANGTRATQRMWVYGPDDQLVEEVEIVLDTVTGGRGRTAQKVGGSTATLAPLHTYADDWYVSTTMRGPLRIGEGGAPVGD